MQEDMHLHTNYSDGMHSLEEMAKTAHALGYHQICFTDHVRASSEWVPMYQNECRYIAHKYKPAMRIFCGVEAKVCDFNGNLDIPSCLSKEIRRIAAIHRLPIGKGKFLRKEEFSENIQFAQACWFKTLYGLNQNPDIHQLAHPFSLLPLLKFSLSDSFWNRIISIFDAGNYLIEYNVKYDNSYVPPNFWTHFRGRIVRGSDSHSVDELMTRSNHDLSIIREATYAIY